MATTLEEFSRLTADIYACATNPQHWTVALAGIDRTLGAVGSGLTLGQGANRAIVAATVPAESIPPYCEYYHALDFVVEACESGPVGLVRGGHEFGTARKALEFYIDWQRPFELTDGLFVRLAVGAEPASYVVTASEQSEPFDTADRVRLVSALLPHIQQALRAQQYMVDLTAAAAGTAQVIDTFRHGIAVVAADGRAIQLNAAAEQTLALRDGLGVRSGIIRAADGPTDEQLQASIRRACGEPGCGPRAGDALGCIRPSRKRPFAIHVLPHDPVAVDSLPGKALLIVIDPEQEPQPPKVLIRRLFGLTEAEADVALRVMHGDGLGPIAAELGLSRATVNTHLQHIYDKTATHRQAELVRLLMTIAR